MMKNTCSCSSVTLEIHHCRITRFVQRTLPYIHQKDAVPAMSIFQPEYDRAIRSMTDPITMYMESVRTLSILPS